MIKLKHITKLFSQQNNHQNKLVNLLDNDTEWLSNRGLEKTNFKNQMKLFLIILVLLKEILMKFIILKKLKLPRKKNKSLKKLKKLVFLSKDRQGSIDSKN